MNATHFKQLYAFLLLIAAVLAFVVPTRADGFRASVQTVFWPVARPAHLVGSLISRRVASTQPYDDGSPRVDHSARSVEEILAENQALRVQLANYTGRLAELESLDKVLASVGDVRSLCRRFSVSGGGSDVASRQSLQIAGAGLSDIAVRMPVLFGGAAGDSSGNTSGGGGIAGWIDRITLAGATVQLVTDKAFVANVGFARFVAKPDKSIDFVMIATQRVQARGDGNGKLVIRNLSWQQTKDAELRAGDWVVLSDEEWPEALQRYRVGRIEDIQAAPKGAGYPIITVRPPVQLQNLRDVMVMVRAK